MTITSASTGRPLGVGGLHANSSTSRFCTRGAMSCMWTAPCCHPRHVPYFSCRAVIPKLLYVRSSQLPALEKPGLPDSRGPMESISAWPIRSTCDSFMPNCQSCLMTGSAERNVCAPDRHGVMTSATTVSRRDGMCMDGVRVDVVERWTALHDVGGRRAVPQVRHHTTSTVTRDSRPIRYELPARTCRWRRPSCRRSSVRRWHRSPAKSASVFRAQYRVPQALRPAPTRVPSPYRQGRR